VSEVESVSGPIPRQLGRYEIQEEIGHGMMGVVYRALDPELHRTVALKTVQLAWAISAEDRESFEKRFMAEARVAAGLAHPGIVVVHDVGRDPGTNTVFIAMEYLQGRTLAEVTSNAGTLDWPEALRITARVAEALHHAHLAGVVHRDVKPANILIQLSGEPKIMDFGIAKIPASQVTAAGEFFGTPSYMSPEQAAGAPVDARSDVFSLGSVLYLLMTGRRAFDASNVPAILARVTGQDPPEPSRIALDLPKEVDYLVARALAKSPAYRYPSALAFAEDCDDVREGRPPRHREGWLAPPRADSTLEVELHSLVEPETADLRRTGFRPARQEGRRTRALLAAMGVLAVVAGFFVFSREGRAPGPAAPAVENGDAGSAETDASPSGEESSTSSFHLPFSLPHLGPPPARLDVTLQHPLRSGRLRVWVDDDLVIDKPLSSRVTKKVLLYKQRRGRFHEVVDAPPGDHRLRVRVDGDGFGETRALRAHLESEVTSHLSMDVGGILTKDLEVSWNP
jgi:eukaryotic-like serine/threonine-protein kinase